MAFSSRKRDRTARLLRLQLLLWQNQNGITISEIARKCEVSERTVFRDLIALETELKVPLWGEGNKRGILEGYFLPPITLSVKEAVNIFISSRLMLQMSQIYSPDITATFMKMNSIVQQPLKWHTEKTIEKMESLPKNEVRFRNFEKLTEAWASQRLVRLVYQETGTKSEKHFIEIYFIEPDFIGRCSNIIAYDRQKKIICTFKTNRIVGDVVIEDETFDTPGNFDVHDYIDEVFGVYTSKNVTTFKFRFSSKVNKAVLQTNWNRSQKMEPLDDGSIIMTLRMRNTVYLRRWILAWGAYIEVLKPKWLRDQMIAIYETLGAMYRSEVKIES